MNLDLIDKERYDDFIQKYQLIDNEIQRLKTSFIQAEDTQANEVLDDELSHEYSLANLLKRPKVDYPTLAKINNANCKITDRFVYDIVQSNIKYEGYINRALDDIGRVKKSEAVKIPEDIDYTKIGALSTEVMQKLSKFKPQNIGIASRISGITPASISILLIYLKK
jgi:tRNA uridine 5-carboxymethylaminomethyl modification enzyme